MFIVFEGIDGSGKTTVSNRVAKALRKRGIDVEHVREGGEFALAVVRRMREFGKDKRNFELVPLAELLLYVARDAQLLSEAILPAIEDSQIVFADRYLYSYEALGCDGRGLDRDRVRAVLDAVAGGVWPDLVVLCDADPHVARARRKVRKIERSAAGKVEESTGGSRKGLGGLGVNHRVRDGYLAIAERERDRWLVVDNTYGALDEVVARVTAAVVALHGEGTAKAALAAGRAEPAAPPRAERPDVRAAAEAFYGFIAERAEREPGVAAYFLAGLDDEIACAWLDRLADTVPAVVAHGIRGSDTEHAWELRERLIADAPYQVARSLGGAGVDPKRAHALRTRLLDDQPCAVLASIYNDQSREAWSIRRKLADAWLPQVTSSVRYNDGAEAWALRDRLAATDGAFENPELARPLAASLRGLDSERAWALRRRLFEVAPTSVLGSLTGVFDDESWAWRQRYAERAPKVVMRTFDGSDDPRAWALRAAFGERVKEALDSMLGMDGPEAWALRERCADFWPSTTLKTLVLLARTERASKMMRALIERHPSNLSLLKHATRIAAILAELAALEVVV